MRSTSELSALWLWLCCASLLLLAFTSLCPAVANPQRRSALHSSPSDLPTTFSFSSLPPEQQRIRLEYLTPAYLHVPYLPIPSLSTPSPSPSPFQPPPTCPCSNSTLCLPLFLPPRPELFIFQVRPSDWSSYDWSSLTTVVLTTHLDPALLCYAHAHSARLVLLTDLTPQQLTNASYRSAWVTSNVHAVASTHIDGLNVDFESPLNATGAAVYSELVKELGEWLRSEVKGSQLTVDVAWSPNCIDGRCYDVVALAAEVDFLFVMAYDMRSQIFDLDDCRASANSPIRLVEAGLRNYTRLGVQPHKLVLGVPWYFYDYRCQAGTAKDAVSCPMAHVPYQGAPCSDAAAVSGPFADLAPLLNRSVTGRQWNETFASPWFNYVDARQAVHQVWADDVESLGYKYRLARSMGLRGVGMWTADFLDYSTPSSSNVTRAMWTALKQAFVSDDAGKESDRGLMSA